MKARVPGYAKEVFTRDRAAASLDDLTRQANIGSGTLYRHFPTRNTLIEAVYRREEFAKVRVGDLLAK